MVILLLNRLFLKFDFVRNLNFTMVIVMASPVIHAVFLIKQMKLKKLSTY